jgi:hypothetical protein
LTPRSSLSLNAATSTPSHRSTTESSQWSKPARRDTLTLIPRHPERHRRVVIVCKADRDALAGRPRRRQPRLESRARSRARSRGRKCVRAFRPRHTRLGGGRVRVGWPVVAGHSSRHLRRGRQLVSDARCSSTTATTTPTSACSPPSGKRGQLHLWQSALNGYRDNPYEVEAYNVGA